MLPKRLTRREVLKMSAAAGAAGLTSSLLNSCGGRPAIPTPPGTTSTCAKITDIDHVVIFIQENRSFDHYFGSYRGVRGFSDASAAFNQPYLGNTSSSPAGVLLPFHLDTTQTNAAHHDITHDWIPQHQSWDNGAMNGFVNSRLPINANDAVLSMGYYTRADLPYYYAVADAFTLCDNYCCSVIGPTDPNRLYTMAASIDPDGKNGGPLLQTLVSNRATMFGKLTYTTMPEQLQAGGISWKIYSTPDASAFGALETDNVLPYFKNFQDPATALYQNAFNPVFPTDFAADALSGNLPQVSWIIGSVITSDHPPAPALFGETRSPPSSPPSPQIPSPGQRPFSLPPMTRMAASSITSRPSLRPPALRANTSPRHQSPTPLSRAPSPAPSVSAFACPCSSSRPSPAAASSLPISSITHQCSDSSRLASAPRFPISLPGAELRSAT